MATAKKIVTDFMSPHRRLQKASTLMILLMSFIALGCCQTTELDIQKELLGSINKFSNLFYTKTGERMPKDLIMSPLSAQFALALLSLGAGGKTLEEINTALFLSSSEFTKSAFKSAMVRLNSTQGVTLNIANKIYVKEGEEFVLNPDFKNDAIESFSSDIENINFSLAEDAARTINTWVEQKTNSKIKNIIDPDSLNERTRLILINAIYFKGTWLLPFDVTLTTKRNFRLSSSKTVEVDMMNNLKMFNYANLSQWDAQALEMHYEKRNVSMVIILPNQVEGLADLEKNVMNSDIKQSVFDVLTPTDVSVSIPKFKIETTMELKPILEALGMQSMFTGAANLNGLLKSGADLFVSSAIQKAFIEVNEEGAEAAAVTVIGVSATSTFVREIVTERFDADHGFLYFIKMSTGEILFMGRFGLNTEKSIVIEKPKNPIDPTPKPKIPTRRPRRRIPKLMHRC